MLKIVSNMSFFQALLKNSIFKSLSDSTGEQIFVTDFIFGSGNIVSLHIWLASAAHRFSNFLIRIYLTPLNMDWYVVFTKLLSVVISEGQILFFLYFLLPALS